MEDKRAQTLQALSTFIEKQRALLTRTHADIDRLNELRSRVVTEPEEITADIEDALDEGAFRLSELGECAPTVPRNIDWSLYARHDPSPLQALANRAKAKHQTQPAPNPVSSSDVSDLQKLIRDAKASILDPVFAEWNLSYNAVPDPSDDETDKPPPVDPAALKKAKEREKIKELKKRKIMSCGLTVTPSGHRTRGPGGVFIRRDVLDESMEVDISLDLNDAIAKPTALELSAPPPTKASASTNDFPPYTHPSASALPPHPLAPSPNTPNGLSSNNKPFRTRNSVTKASAANNLFSKGNGKIKMMPATPTPAPPPLMMTTRHGQHQRRRSSRTFSAASGSLADMDVDFGFGMNTPMSPDVEGMVAGKGAGSMDVDVDPQQTRTAFSPPTSSSTPAPRTPHTHDSVGPEPDLDPDELDHDHGDFGPPSITKLVNGNGKGKGKRAREPKPKPETYKQAWSTSEQQLLEALLEEIPEGEKNRWKKISKAMNGRRTPRQVASRVQKYFEKLKKFGIET